MPIIADQKKEFTRLKNLLKEGESGLSKIFIDYNKAEIYCLNIKKGEGYIYDNKKALYVELCKNSMIGMIGRILQMTINTLISYSNNTITQLREILDGETADIAVKNAFKEIKELETLKKKVGSTQTQEAIFKQLMEHYFKPEMAIKFNTQENMLPIKTNKVIDLSNGHIRNRTSEHYFTYELDFEYLGRGNDCTPKTNKFFNQLATENKVKAKYLKLVMGSSITTDTKMKCFYIFCGYKGNNGKSTLLAIHSKNFDKLSTAIDPNILFTEKADKVDETSYGLF